MLFLGSELILSNCIQRRSNILRRQLVKNKMLD